MRVAANATISLGYFHFEFADAGIQQGSVVVGAMSTSDVNFNGNYGAGFVSGTEVASAQPTLLGRQPRGRQQRL
jgi:hypothetical protein